MSSPESSDGFKRGSVLCRALSKQDVLEAVFLCSALLSSLKHINFKFHILERGPADMHAVLSIRWSQDSAKDNISTDGRISRKQGVR